MIIFGLKYFLGMFSSLSLSFLSITIVNIALFVLNFLNLPQADILTKAEKHFETLKVTSLPLPIWYQDGLTNLWKSKKLILQGKGYASISPDGSNELIWLPLQKIQPKGAPNIQTRDNAKKKTQEEGIPKQATVTSKISKKRCTRHHQTYDLPTWGQINTLTNQAENPISQQGMPRNPENIFLCYACFACFCFPGSGWLDRSHLMDLCT